MINLKDPRDQTPSALAIVGIVVGVGSLLVTGFAVPKEPAHAKRKHNVEMAKIKEEQQKTDQDIASHNSLIQRYRWSQKIDDVAPAALDTVTKLAKKYNLTLISFRPQKTVDSATLVQLPFQMIVDGTFTNVANVIQSLETSDSKLAVQQVQYAGKEGESDVVTANINLVAFVMKPEAKAKAPATTTPPPTTGVKKNG